MYILHFGSSYHVMLLHGKINVNGAVQMSPLLVLASACCMLYRAQIVLVQMHLSSLLCEN